MLFVEAFLEQFAGYLMDRLEPALGLPWPSFKALLLIGKRGVTKNRPQTCSILLFVQAGFNSTFESNKVKNHQPDLIEIELPKLKRFFVVPRSFVRTGVQQRNHWSYIKSQLIHSLLWCCTGAQDSNSIQLKRVS
jgi:hypothetical protein